MKSNSLEMNGITVLGTLLVGIVVTEDVPADYRRWLFGQPDVDLYLLKALRGEAA
jgi:hypothetical protein